MIIITHEICVRGIFGVSKAQIWRNGRSRSTDARSRLLGMWLQTTTAKDWKICVMSPSLSAYDRKDNLLLHMQCAHCIHHKSLQWNIVSQGEVDPSYQNWTWCECRQEVHVTWIFQWEVIIISAWHVHSGRNERIQTLDMHLNPGKRKKNFALNVIW